MYNTVLPVYSLVRGVLPSFGWRKNGPGKTGARAEVRFRALTKGQSVSFPWDKTKMVSLMKACYPLTRAAAPKPRFGTLPRAALVFLFAALLFTRVPVAGAEPSPSIREIDRIVAVVNDEVVVESELNEKIREFLAEQRQSGRESLPLPAALRKQALERLILDRLQLQVAGRMGIRIDDNQLNRTIASLAKRNGLEPRQFRQVLERDGYDFGAFRNNIRRQLMITELQKRQLAKRVQVSDREIDNYLALQSGSDGKKEYRLAHILIAVKSSTDKREVARAKEKAEDAVRRLRAGADFSKLAMTISDSQQALEGGDLGWRKAKQLPSLLADAVPGMTPGRISDPLWDSSGFHIVKLVGVRGDQRHMVTQTRARHILVHTDPLTSDNDARTRLEQIRERVIQGEDFEELAKSHSDDRGTAIKGGNLGWVGSGDVVPEFEEKMDALRPTEVSVPFRSRFGWHIVQVLERRQRDGTDEALRAAARAEIQERKIDEELNAWLDQLRAEAYVEYRLEED